MSLTAAAPIAAAVTLAVATVSALALAVSAGGCRQRSTARVEGRITPPPGAPGALVLPLDGARDPFPVVPGTGAFTARYGAIHVQPASIHLFVHIPGRHPLILKPERDFKLQPRDGDLVASATFDTAQIPLPRLLPLTCLSEACTADLPADADGCRASAILLDGPRATLLAPGERDVKAGAKIRAPLPMREGRPRSLVLVATCKNDDYVSDVAEFDNP
ncbi:Hypothetical protein CAP_4770 [Chondromyces apiculatus DSM 436]|uniref:Lipoprotein n=1 Tax=Chondromyces apiculatus DSM 436 TaxID=1192034 RepID=A0A017T533_9BACT|nr:Hypothetical protein CAP_4770 [Chondromyces apiculatus DSM 436]